MEEMFEPAPQSYLIAIYLIYFFFAMALGISQVYIFTRSLGVEKYALYVIITSTLPFIAGFLNLGLGSTLPRIILSRKISERNKRGFIGFSLILMIFFVIISIIIVFIAGFFEFRLFDIKNYYIFIFLIILGALFAAFQILANAGVNRPLEQFKILILIYTSSILSTLFTLICVVFFELEEVLPIIFLIIFFEMFPAMISFYSIVTKSSFSFFKINKDDWKLFFKSWYIHIVTGLFTIAYSYIQKFILYAFISAHSLAYFSVALSVTTLLNLGICFRFSSYPNAIKRWENGGTQEIEKYFLSTIKSMVFLLMVVTIGLYVLAPEIVLLLAGQEFYISRFFVLPLLLTVFLQLIRTIIPFGFLIIIEKARLGVKIIITSYIIGFVYLGIFTILWGIQGVILAILLKEMTEIILNIIYKPIKLNIFQIPYIRLFFGFFVSIILSTFLFNSNMLFRVFMIIFFILLIIILGGVKKADFNDLIPQKNILNRMYCLLKREPLK